jgi:prepilin-type N-terminal cleavage/methylation domain-containing protein
MSVRATRRNAGFTLIELIVVIGILALVGMIALPYFTDLRRDTYKAAVTAVIGQFQSAVHLSYQLCVVRGWAGRDNVTGLGSSNVDFNTNCYPSDTSNSNLTTSNAARCVRIFNGIMNSGYTINTTTATNVDFRVTLTGGNCRFTFRRDTSVTRRFDYRSADGALLNITNP